jgi:branched-chain amino acid aminotransferase
MPAPLAYLNGSYIPFEQLSVPILDVGFVQGVTVVEQLRTFGGKLFRWDEHLARLRRSLAIIGLDPGLGDESFGEIAQRLIEHNHRLLAEGDDLGLAMLITPGTYSQTGAEPWIALYTTPVAFAGFAGLYATGQRLVTADVRQVPPDCWPAELKCRSRMHYYLADRQARRVDPQSRALLLNLDGTVAEASTANFLAYFEQEGIVSPPREVVLPGVSMSALSALAAELQIPFSYRPLHPAELEQAAEAFLTSTSPCILPVTAIDGRPLGDGRPGPLFERLLTAWSRQVGVSIRQQAQRFASR